MMKKLWTLVSLLVVFAMLLVACAPAATTVAPEPTKEPVVVEPTKEPVVVEPTKEPVVEPTKEPVAPVATIRIWADDTRSAIFKDLADEFLAAYNVEVVVEEVAAIRDQFLIAAPAGEGPDIIMVPHDQAGALVANGLLAEIDLGDKAAAFTESSLASVMYDGKMYGMPFATENLGFFYNTDLVPTAPATWDEVITVGTALKGEGKVDFCMGISGTTYDLYPLFTAFGGYIFGKDANGNYNPEDLGLDNEGMIKAGEFIDANVKSGCFSDSTDWDTAHVLFETGKVPFLMAGPWALDRIRASGVKYAITDFPSGGFPFSGVQVLVVNSQSENILLAQAFLTEFVATDAVMEKLYIAGNRPSPFKSVLEKTADPDFLAMGKAGINATSMPTIAAMGAVWGSWNDAVTLIFQQKQAPADALKEGAVKIRNLIANPLTGMVNVPGSYQAAAGCSGDWLPDCDATKMTKADDGTWTSGPFKLPAGDYEAKVAMDGTWGLNYGMEGKENGDNYKFSLTAESEVSFVFDPATKLLTINIK